MARGHVKRGPKIYSSRTKHLKANADLNRSASPAPKELASGRPYRHILGGNIKCKRSGKKGHDCSKARNSTAREPLNKARSIQWKGKRNSEREVEQRSETQE